MGNTDRKKAWNTANNAVLPSYLLVDKKVISFTLILLRINLDKRARPWGRRSRLSLRKSSLKLHLKFTG
jgi:hypothetical protein